MITFNRAKNVGLGLLLFILLVFAVLGHWESRLTQRAIDQISVVHNPEHGRTMQYINLLHSAELAFEIYRRRESVDPDVISNLFDDLAVRSDVALAQAPAQIQQSMAVFNQFAIRARVAWMQTLDMWDLDDDLTSDSVFSSSEIVFQELAKSRQMLAPVRDEIKDRDLSYDVVSLNRIAEIVGLAELEIDRFLNQEPINVRDVLDPVDRILKVAQPTLSAMEGHAGHHAGHHMASMQDADREIRNLSESLRNILFALEDSQVDMTDAYHDELTDKAASVLKKIDIAVRSVGDHSVEKIDDSTEMLNASLQRSRFWRNVLTAIGMVLAFVVSILLGRTLGSRVRAVTEGTEALAAGEFSHRIPVPHRDQLGQLATSFNQMAETLQSQEVERELHLLAVDEAVTRAQAASASKSEFLASMSHEIRTPINGVLGAADLLLRESLTRSQRHLTETINRSGKALLGIINDILDFSKIEAGQMEVEETRIDLVLLIEDVAEMAAPSAHKKGLELTSVIAPAFPAIVFGDALRLRQVITNLVSNAVKFTETGEVVLEVNARQTSINTAMYRFSVRDTGIGISAQAQEVVFNSFTQADRSTTRNYGGTGLGLAISHQLVRLLGGELKLTSTQGEGSEFFFSLPLQQEHALTDHPTQSFTKLRALLASGNASTLLSLGYQMQVFDIDFATATSGHQALAILDGADASSEQSFDAVFIDNHLDDMGGLEFAQLIKTDTAAQALVRKVALCLVGESGSANNARLMSELSLHLTKPVRQSALYNCLLEISGQDPVMEHMQFEASSDVLLQGNVLLAEDHSINQMIITRMLRHLGCEVSVVDDGLQALKVLGTTQFDLVLMDCDMPELDGFETTRRMREDEARTGACAQVVVALTANALKGDREKCLAAGMDDYLTKPIDIDGLSAALTKWLPTSNDAQTTELPSANAGTVESATEDYETLDQSVIAGLVELGNGNFEFFKELVEVFSHKSSQDLVALHNAIESGENETVRKAAHRLKSSSANLGAVALAGGCGKVELAAKLGEMNNASLHAAKLDQELARTLDALQVFCRKAA